MIVYDLECLEHTHRFEGWFGSSEDFARQQERGLVACPHCGSTQVIKAPMAPRLTRKGNQIDAPAPQAKVPAAEPAPAPVAAPPPPLPPQLRAALEVVVKAQAEALKSSRWVGEKFVDDARAMHYGDKAPEAIHGQATPDQAQALADEGIDVAPILFPLAPPDQVN
ncbi:DUF1178 family protein [Novosphingobium sp. FSY-8]|uniref:DUF1178 family protein n=1 Tax=Novosphingobium ovatum TaxID=1908523 RepID=A0ABW9XC98_9SPHN|nr:DUF1178 family protein [Novosphingobium ovatum]NBC36138.1 DUF1178 family protein [Novosphingobium ovatum]